MAWLQRLFKRIASWFGRDDRMALYPDEMGDGELNPPGPDPEGHINPDTIQHGEPQT